MILGEIYAGDTWVFNDEKKVHSHDRELESIEKTMRILPEEKYLNMKILGWNLKKGRVLRQDMQELLTHWCHL